MRRDIGASHEVLHDSRKTIALYVPRTVGGVRIGAGSRLANCFHSTNGKSPEVAIAEISSDDERCADKRGGVEFRKDGETKTVCHGKAGNNGDKGEPGTPGAKGDTGPTSPIGATGPQGAKGEKGGDRSAGPWVRAQRCL